MSLAKIVARTVSRKLPDLMIFYAVAGWGKTSLAAQATSPIFLMSKSELGLIELMQNGQIDDVPYLQFLRHGELQPDAHTWEEVIGTLNLLLKEEHDRKTLVIDTLNGLARLCCDYVCLKQFGGDWGEKGFMSYQKGYRVTLPEWDNLFGLLNQLRAKGMRIIALCHNGIGKVPNPEGPEYTKHTGDMHIDLWNLAVQRASLVLFGQYRIATIDTDPKKKTKAKGGTVRLVYTTSEAGRDAKHRHGLPEIIEVSNVSATEAWNDFMAAFQ